MKFVNTLTFYGFLFLFISFWCLTESCEKAKISDPSCSVDTSNVSYRNHILPIVQANCTFSGCHDGKYPTDKHNLNHYDDLKEYFDRGVLIPTLNWELGYKRMPREEQKLTDCQLSVINNWAKQGARNN